MRSQEFAELPSNPPDPAGFTVFFHRKHRLSRSPFVGSLRPQNCSNENMERVIISCGAKKIYGKNHGKPQSLEPHILVGGFFTNPFGKYSSKWVHLPQFSGWKLKNIWSFTNLIKTEAINQGLEDDFQLRRGDFQVQCEFSRVKPPPRSLQIEIWPSCRKIMHLKWQIWGTPLLPDFGPTWHGLGISQNERIHISWSLISS